MIERSSQTVYLDCHASTPCDPRVVEALLPHLVEHYANPSNTLHPEGRKAAAAVEEARGQVAALLGCRPGEIVFTSGATESNNLAIKGCASANRTERRRVLVSAVEHKCVLESARALTSQGYSVDIVPVLSDGTIDLAALSDLLGADVFLVSVQAVNNEVGTIQPVASVAQLAHGVGAVVHCDAAQAPGRIPVSAESWDVDLLSISAHKMYGPKGVGALFVRGGGRNAPLVPLSHGGGQEGGLRSGTLNVPGIVGLGCAAKIAHSALAVDTGRICQLRDALEATLMTSVGGITINGALERRVAGNSSLSIQGVDAEALLVRMPHVAMGTGSACSSGAQEPSHVLTAMGLSRTEAYGTIRIGLGRFTSPQDVLAAASALEVAVGEMRELSRAVA